jgi:hypothetical protein
MNILKNFIYSAAVFIFLSSAVFAQQQGSLAGQVQDSFGAALVGATVTVTASDGTERTATTDDSGNFLFTGLSAGNYSVQVFSEGFQQFEGEVTIAAGRREQMIATMVIDAFEEQVEVNVSNEVSTDPDATAGATILREEELAALPDDPDELEAALQALAGPAAGPNGGQIYIDGFTGGQMPPKESIREIRINQNPFSAEYDRLGFGRIEILTRPGTDTWRGSVFGNFNDYRLNSRNPFAENRAPSQMFFYGGNVSGPIQKGKSSFFLNINNRRTDENTVVNARILDQNLNVIPFQQDIQVPSRRFSISPRFDYAINENNTLVARYNFTRNTRENIGVGGISLPSRGYQNESTSHQIQMTETMIINPTTINETRVEFEWNDRDQLGDNSIPTISVADAFSGGGSQIGLSFDREREFEFQNYTTTSVFSNHALKFGVRVRHVSISDRSENNYGGAFTFINLDQYRDTLLGNAYPTQFSITTGEPLQKVSRTDYGLFITDDWRVTPGLTLSFGLRYENQTNINDNLNFAPRFSFAWAPGAGGPSTPKTVFRGGFGIFYDRFSENLTLQAQRFNGTNQLNLIVNANDPDPVRRAAAIALLQQPVFTLDGVTNVPTAADVLAVLPQSNTIRTISPELQSPYMFQTALGVERQLPWNSTISAFYIGSRTWHVLRTRNINAPICPEQVNCLNAPRPDPTQGNIYQYESSGVQNTNQFILNFRTTLSNRVSLFGNYRLGYSKGDADGAGSFPAYAYDLSGEYGRTSGDIRHNFFFGGNIRLPWEISMSPFIMGNTGRPFNITLGRDLNSDSLFNERPTFAQLGARCAELGLTNSFCDVSGYDPNAIIPRNFGEGPKYLNVNLRFSKNFGFGSTEGSGGAVSGPSGPGGGGGIPVGRGGGMRGGGMRGMGGGGGGRAPYNLNVGVSFNNIFNLVNFNPPVGNMASSRFGQFTSTAGGWGMGGGSTNRRIELNLRFSW